MLRIWNLKYYRYFFIIKFVGLELIFFTIDMNVASLYEVFSNFDYVSINCMINLNQ